MNFNICNSGYIYTIKSMNNKITLFKNNSRTGL